MIPIVPENLKTFRFTYVDPDFQSNPFGIGGGDVLSSMTDGIYGLLNEFMAYCWGMNNTVCLYDYYDVFGAQGSSGGSTSRLDSAGFPDWFLEQFADQLSETDKWQQYISDGKNGRQAYAEFLYYILTYLRYAESNYPEIYRGILENAELKTAFRMIEETFASRIQTFESSLNGFSQGIGSSNDSDYRLLMDAVAQPEYQRMLSLLRG